MSDNIQFDILQFDDDTIMLSNGHLDNLWSIKGIIRGFKLVSELGVNLAKTKKIGINLKNDYISVVATFLAYDTSTLPIKFLRVVMGSNPKRQEY